MNEQFEQDFEAVLRKSWNNDPELRHEFMEFENLLYYSKAKEQQNKRNRPNLGMMQEEEIRERCQSKWNQDPEMRKTFLEFEDYVAYETMFQSGRVRVAGGSR